MLRIAINFYFIALLSYSLPALAQNNDASTFQALYDSAKKHRSPEKGQLALNFALEQNIDTWIAKSYFMIAFYQKKNSDYYDALKNYFSALKHYKYDKDNRGQVKTLINIANIYARAKFFEKSLSFFEDAFALADESVETKNIARLNYSYAMALQETGDYNTAEKFYLIALEQFKEIDDKPFIGDSYLELGKNSVFTKRYSEAKKYYSLSVDVFAKESPEWENTLLKKLNSFAYIAIQQGESDNALKTLQSALQLSTNDTRNKGVLSEIYENIGRIYRDRHHADSAVLMYAKSVELGDFYAYDRNYIQTCEYLYRHFYQNNDSRAVNYHDTIYNFGDELAELQKKLNQEHISYQVEAANFRREAELQYQAKQMERLRTFAAVGLAVVLVIALFYVIRKERLRTRRVRVFLNSMYWK